MKLICGDCLEVMKTLPDKSVDAVITDPPYGIHIAGKGRIGGNGRITKVRQYRPVTWDDNGLTKEQFIEMARISYYQIIFGFEHLSDILKRAESVFVWDKKCRNGWDDNFSDCEIAWTNIPGPTKMFRHLWMGALRASEKDAGAREHPTQKPTEVMTWIIQHYTSRGEIIFDPFMGSGTTGVACVQMGRDFIGIEIDPGYFAIAERRIKEAQAQLKLFKDTP